MIDSIRNTNTLSLVCKEIEGKYKGWKFDRLQSYYKDVYDMYLSNGDTVVAIRFDLSPKYSSFFILSKEPKYNNTSYHFSNVEGHSLISIKTLNSDRIVKMDFGKYQIIGEIFGRGGSRLLQLSTDRKIRSVVGKDSDNGRYELPSIPHSDENPLRLPKIYLEIAQKIGLDYTEIKESVIDADTFYLYRTVNNNFLFSHLPLDHQSLDKQIFYSDSPSEIIEQAVSRSRYEDRYLELFSHIRRLNNKEKRKLENKIKAFGDSDSLIEKAENNRLHGDILMARPDIKTKAKTLDTNDWEGNPISIQLDEKITILENAQKFYEKSKNLEKTVEEHIELLPAMEAELEKVLEVEAELESRPRYKELEKIQKNHRWLQGQTYSKPKKEDKFRKFPLSDSYTLYVGKSAANNDELTNHFAKPSDLWLHAKDVSGSHGVIKGGNAEDLPQELLEKAAQIIAYYSSARNQSYVPVSYVQKKYVRKPKGAAIGAVIMTREDVVFVEPGKN